MRRHLTTTAMRRMSAPLSKQPLRPLSLAAPAASSRKKPNAFQHKHAPVASSSKDQVAIKTESVPVRSEQADSVRFDEMKLSDKTLRALHEVFKYEELSLPQKATLPVALQQKDVFAKSCTGSGKTLAFLIPTVEALVRDPVPAGDIGALILSPARELASQTNNEATKLLTFHGLTTQVMVGGTNRNADVRALKNPGHILIATPGRLLDHLENTHGFKERLQNLRVLVLDEADRLLDMGFYRDIAAIAKFLPPAGTRQGLLFTATASKEVLDVAKKVMKPSYEFVDVIGNHDHEHARNRIDEKYIISQFQLWPHHLLRVLKNAMKEPNYKIIVFFTTANFTKFYYELFKAAGIPNLLQMHSRLSQSARDKAAKTFKESKEAIIFSSDVIARGLDFPDVSLVVQVGLPDATQYEHRIGRTARAGKHGDAILILDKCESGFISKLGSKPQELQFDDKVSKAMSDILNSIDSNSSLSDAAAKAYQASLGFYNSNLKALKWSKAELVEQMNHLIRCHGVKHIPALQAKTIGKMGLKGTPGLVISRSQ